MSSDSGWVGPGSILTEEGKRRAKLEADMLRDRNPLLLQAETEWPTWVTRAKTTGPPPTLFAAGDLPAFTASGIDPATLLQLPWFVRHAAAAADLVEAHRVFETYTTWDEEAADEWMREAGHSDWNQANLDYKHRFQRWLRDAPLGDPQPVARLMERKPPASADDVVVELVAARAGAADLTEAEINAELRAALAYVDQHGPLALAEMASTLETLAPGSAAKKQTARAGLSAMRRSPDTAVKELVEGYDRGAALANEIGGL